MKNGSDFHLNRFSFYILFACTLTWLELLQVYVYSHFKATYEINCFQVLLSARIFSNKIMNEQIFNNKNNVVAQKSMQMCRAIKLVRLNVKTRAN